MNVHTNAEFNAVWNGMLSFLIHSHSQYGSDASGRASEQIKHTNRSLLQNFFTD